MLLLAVADALVVAALVIVLPPMARRLPDCRRSWQLRWSRSSQVRPELIASLRRGRPAATPALARDVLEYVAIMRRGLALLRSDAYRICGLLFTAAGIVGMVNGVHRDSAEIVLPALITATYPLWTWAYSLCIARKLDRAEAANADLAQRPDLYLVPPAELDCIGNLSSAS